MKQLKELIVTWRGLSKSDLLLQLEELVKQQFKLKMQHSIGELKALHNIKLVKRNIARVLTILKEKELNK